MIKVLSLFLLLTVSVSAADEWTELFDGTSLDGWTIDDKGNPVATPLWSAANGVIALTGRDQPRSALYTVERFSNYELELQWRWPGRGGNSGVLIHASEPSTERSWAPSIEIQLARNKAGEFWLWRSQLVAPESVTNPKKPSNILKLTESSERPMGEWNQLRVIAKGDTIAVYVNDVLQNKAIQVSPAEGMICFQAEGADIEFSNIRLRPLPSE